MNLPRLYVICDRRAALEGCGNAIDAAQAAADAGARFFQIRDRDLGPDDLWRYAENLTQRLAGYSPVITMNERADIALALGLAGVHRPQVGLPMAPLRRLMESQRIIGVSCHDEAELRDAAGLGADFVTLSPVYGTPSKPRAKPLGAAAFGELAKLVDVPVYALGGIAPGHIHDCLEAGAYGVAVLSGIMASEDPYDATRRYLAALGAN